MKFKVGDKVRAIKNDYILTNQKSEWEGVVTKLYKDSFAAKTTHSIRLFEIGYEYHGLTYEDFELIFFKKGDKVKLKPNFTLSDLYENNSHGCLHSTVSFIEQELYDHGDSIFDKVYEIDKANNRSIILKNYTYPINNKLFILHERKEDVKEMTLEEACKELGYEIKIVKEKK